VARKSDSRWYKGKIFKVVSLHQSFTHKTSNLSHIYMSASDSAAGHAVRPDGRLKDTSEMEWTYDKDESIPFPSSTPAVSTSDNTGSSSSIPLESARIHPFFTQGKPPAVIVAGSRCSARTSRPSQRVQEATEVSSLAAGSTSAKPTTGSKRKAAESSPGPAH